jgi:hypothetical protein
MRAISLRSVAGSVVRAIRTGGGRARFTGSLRGLDETVQQRGTKTTRSSGTAGCTATHRFACRPLTRVLHDRSTQLVSRRLHRLGFRPLVGLVPADLLNGCPGEPTAVRHIGGGLDLAAAKYGEADVFDSNVGGITLQGTADVTTQTLSGSAKVVQHVAWTLTLRRLGG